MIFEVWFIEQSSQPLEIEDRINLTLVIKWYIYLKNALFNWIQRLNICKTLWTLSFTKNISNKYSQKLFDSAKTSTTDAIKTASKRGSQQKAEIAGDLIGNKFEDKVTSVSKLLHPKKSWEINLDEANKIEISNIIV